MRFQTTKSEIFWVVYGSKNLKNHHKRCLFVGGFNGVLMRVYGDHFQPGIKSLTYCEGNLLLTPPLLCHYVGAVPVNLTFHWFYKRTCFSKPRPNGAILVHILRKVLIGTRLKMNTINPMQNHLKTPHRWVALMTVYEV